ncbi:MAG: lipid-binding SYLF domain-containing protein [Terriglobia bacterium]
MRRVLTLLVIIVVMADVAFAGRKENERLQNCGRVLKEVLDIPDSIPQELLARAECVGVIPSVKKFALGIGGSFGKGAFVCRTGKNFTGPWSAPAMYRLGGANIGIQLGGQATDFIFLVMNPKGVNSLLKSKFKLSGDMAAAAGPKGRTATAATDVLMKAEILAYSRSRGLFAGVSVEGSTLRQDNGANKKVYGRKLDARQILREGAVGVPGPGQQLVGLLNTHYAKNLSDPKSLQD